MSSRIKENIPITGKPMDNKLISRWDNASHWKNINTFPYHKHIEKKSNVVFSTEVYLDEILGVIEKKIAGK